MFISFIQVNLSIRIKIGEIVAQNFLPWNSGVLILVFQCNFRSDPGGSSRVPAEFIIVCTDEEEFAAVC